MDKKKICVVGHFAFGKEALNGQTIKTKTITNELEHQLGTDEVTKIDTSVGKKGMLTLFFQIMSEMRRNKNIVMLPAHNGIYYFTPLLWLGKKIYRTQISYIVIGGWLSDFIKEKKFLKRLLKKFDGIYVETNIMKKSLEQQGFDNIYIMPNCKNINILKEDELIVRHNKPYKLCTFSRVMKEKGIEDAIRAVEEINEKSGEIVFDLDIYGQVDVRYEKEFVGLQKKFPSYIRYCGSVNFDQSTNVLKNYYALLFPTYYSGEGFAGTLIDAMAAGIPVVASDWKYNGEIVQDQKTGFLYPTKDNKKLVRILENIQKRDICYMKKQCLREALKYEPYNAIQTFIKSLG